jgi:hypothetical protein
MTKTTIPRPFVFVLMPFDREFDDTYELAIKPACDAAGAYAERVDEQIFAGSILDRIYNQIAKADVVVADLTGRNPNVFYETGYAHALGKTTLLLTRSTEDIPFDLKHYPHVVYEGRLSELRGELEKRVRWHLEHPSVAESQSSTLAVRVNEILLAGNPVIDVPIQNGRVGFELRINFHNKIDHVLHVIEFQIGLFSQKEFIGSGARHDPYNVIRSEPDKNLHLPGQSFSLLPGAWETLRMVPHTDNVAVRPGEIYNFSLRAFFQSGIEDFPFIVRLVAATNADD